MSNEYRQFPLEFERDFCESLDKDMFGLQSLFYKYLNGTKCPISKVRKCVLKCRYKLSTVSKNGGWLTKCFQGLYEIKFYIFDATRLPPNIPEGRYKLAASFKSNDKSVAMMIDLFVKVEYFKNY